MLSVKIVQCIHLSLIIFILISPFLSAKYLTISICLLLYIIKNWGKDNKCIFTMIEYLILDHPELETGFIYRLINPIYNFKTEASFDKILNIVVLLWLVLLIVVFIYKSKKTNYFKQTYPEIEQYDNHH